MWQFSVLSNVDLALHGHARGAEPDVYLIVAQPDSTIHRGEAQDMIKEGFAALMPSWVSRRHA